MSDMTCELCGRSFSNRSGLRYHTSNNVCTKKKERRYKCDYCPKTFTHQSSMYRHAKTCKNADCNKESMALDSDKEELVNLGREESDGVRIVGLCSGRSVDVKQRLSRQNRHDRAGSHGQGQMEIAHQSKN